MLLRWRKSTDYKTGRPNTMDGDFTKKPEEGQSDNTKDGSSEN